MIRRQSSKQFALEINDHEVIFNIESDDNSVDDVTIEHVDTERCLSKLPHQLQVPFQGLKYEHQTLNRSFH